MDGLDWVYLDWTEIVSVEQLYEQRVEKIVTIDSQKATCKTTGRKRMEWR